MDVNRRKLLGTVAGISATGVAAAACGGGSTSTTQATTAASGSASSNPLANGTSAPPPSASQINKNGVLNILSISAFGHLDPQNIYEVTATSIARLRRERWRP